MARGRRRDEWERTSWLLAKLHNAFRFGGQPKTPDDFNPMLLAKPRPKPKSRIKDPRLLALEEGTQVCTVQ